MVNGRPRPWWVGLGAGFVFASSAIAQQAGSIRGNVYDADFDAPLPLAEVLIVETGEKVTGTEQGNYLLADVEPGTYTLVFSKAGYGRQVKTGVVVTAGRLTEVNAELTGEFTEMDEFVVQDLQIGGGTEAGLLRLRLQDPALLDSIGADFISRSGASDAAGALRLVSGATVQDDKFAVIRGLPDRFVVSQLNGFRLPTADADKRAVELDQFPAAVIESLQVSKTFTPDQQGDASGGAVNIITTGIPAETSLVVKGELSFNTQVAGRKDFLTYNGGGVSFWGDDDGRQPQPVGQNWDGAVGVSRGDAPTDYKWSVSGGGRHEFDNGITIGGIASFFYEQDSSYYDNGVNNSLVGGVGGDPMVPQVVQQDAFNSYKTRLFDVTRSTDTVQWGGLGAFGLESEHHSLSALYLYTRTTDDAVTLAEDTRGKQYFFPGHDPDDQNTPGHGEFLEAAPYIRTETLVYTERTTQSLQLQGKHQLPIPEWGIRGGYSGLGRDDDVLVFKPPELDWGLAFSSATLNEPDKRQFGTVWVPGRVIDLPDPFDDIIIPPTHQPFTPALNFTLGNLQRVFKDIREDSTQYFVNLKFPFEQWTGDEGFVTVGYFDDQVDRRFNQDSYSNFFDQSNFDGEFGEFWSSAFPDEDHPITAAEIDVDYDGNQDISAVFVMADVPVVSFFNVIGGVRWESTDLSIVNYPDSEVQWVQPGNNQPSFLMPGEADVDFSQDDVLPAIGFTLEPFESLMFRGSYTETVARQTFKELTPVVQQEFLGAPVFIGNPELQMASLQNYDLRLDYTPYDGGLLSVSWFYKDIQQPIEFVQRNVQNIGTFTTPVNYPYGRLQGWEFEVRQDLGYFWDALEGLSVGGNATIIDSSVTLPESEADQFDALGVPLHSRDMTGTPENLYNLYLTYDVPDTGTQLALFYNYTGDTLAAGAGQTNGEFVPNVYETGYGTLNFTLTQKIGEHLSLFFKAKNLTNPAIETVYRTPGGEDVLQTSFTKGIDFVIGLSAEFTF